MAVSTLGEAHDLGWRLRVYCRGGHEDNRTHQRKCTCSADLDVATLVWTRGRGFPIADLGRVFKCIRCGNRTVVIAFEPPPAATRVKLAG